ncbi:MAG TPA: DNA gyrase inhibitor [Treponema sp.]|nr:DNA gyrase inhibitor [Treponema sp.]
MTDSKIETTSAAAYIFMRRTGAYGAENAALMESFKAWLRSRNLLEEDSVILGIAQDDPAVTPPERCRYDVCFLTDDCRKRFEGTFDPVSGNRIEYGTTGGGVYAVFTIEHSAHAVEQAWNNLFAELSKYRLTVDRSRPVVERYACTMVRNHLCEICVPIQQPAG